MAEYSYAQLSQMQKEAAERVAEMRKRARLAAEDASERFDAKQAPVVPTAPAANSAQPQVPKAVSMPNGLQGSNAQLFTGNKSKHPASGKKTDFLQDLLSGKGLHSVDRDRALLLSLCFLLQAEQADEDLILSLLYLLG